MAADCLKRADGGCIVGRGVGAGEHLPTPARGILRLFRAVRLEELLLLLQQILEAQLFPIIQVIVELGVVAGVILSLGGAVDRLKSKGAGDLIGAEQWAGEVERLSSVGRERSLAGALPGSCG